MINANSRYAQVGTASLVVTNNGSSTELHYFKRRFIPAATGQVTFVRHLVVQGDRIDNITAKYLNDPTLFWRICDFNQVLRPEDLTDTPGETIEVALPLFTAANR